MEGYYPFSAKLSLNLCQKAVVDMCVGPFMKSFPFIYWSICTLIAPCLNTVHLEIRDSESYNFVVLFKSCFDYYRPFAFPNEVRVSF